MFEFGKFLFEFLLQAWRGSKDDKLRLERESWQWLERHFPFFEEQAKQVYIVVLHNSAEKVPEEFPNESFPFVEKLSRFPAREDNALKRNYWRLEKKDRQKVWAISKSYIEKWDSCMGKFPSGTPELPHDLVKFEKAGQILRVVCNKRV
ncbi:hypothetical protein [Brucella sp. 22210]|uniref:hypothetical protein n=1 Tax=Brucella sp. 22210 TaxID=3453892 RepID=UPI003F86C085